jgi:hypothetical protein
MWLNVLIVKKRYQHGKRQQACARQLVAAGASRDTPNRLNEVLADAIRSNVEVSDLLLCTMQHFDFVDLLFLVRTNRFFVDAEFDCTSHQPGNKFKLLP